MDEIRRSYPRSLVGRLRDSWSAHARLFAEEDAALGSSDEELRQLVEQAFFASLRPEEGRYLPQGIVLAPALDRLSKLDWELVVLKAPVPLRSEGLAKLAPALGSERYVVVCTVAGVLTIVGLGRPTNDFPTLSGDDCLRIRMLGPGDLVFFKAGHALFRYRAGEVIDLEHDFFAAAGDPAAALAATAQAVFGRERAALAAEEINTLSRDLASICDSLSNAGRGGIVAVLAPDDPERDELVAACDYQIEPANLGRLTVDRYDKALAARLDLAGNGPRSARDPDQLVAAVEEIEAARRRMSSNVASLASVDGALLVDAGLRILGFGCKLPRKGGALPLVATPGDGGLFYAYDLLRHGTRHAAAAHFASQAGRMAFISSADGPVGCFIWSPARNQITYWPVHVGSFAPHRW